jgi:restriction endonuclease S subunit
LGSKVFVIRASQLGRRWDPSFHVPVDIVLPRKGKNLGQLVEMLAGISVPSREYLDESTKEGLVYVRISDINDGEIVGYAARRVPRKYARIQLKEGDILLSMRGSIGKTALVSKQFEGAVPSSQLAVLRPKEHVVNRIYLLRALSSEVVQRQLDRIKTGAIISYVSIVDLKRVVIPLPELDDQLKIVRKFEELERQYKATAKAGQRLRQEMDKIFRVESD